MNHTHPLKKRIGITSLLIFLMTVASTGAYAIGLTGTKNIPGDYATLALAIADLNLNGVGPGGVVINVNAAQTAPAAGASGSVAGAIGNGYVINIATGAPTAANPVTIIGNGNVITAYGIPAAVTNYNDAIITIAGTSYITIRGFAMVENPANTTIAASNNMTEFGVALVGATIAGVHTGSQNCTISECRIELSSTYTGNIGIYSSADNIFTAAYNTSDAPTTAAGANSFNTFQKDTVIGTTSGIVILGDATFNDLSTTIGALSASDSVSLGTRTANSVATAYVNYSISVQDGIYVVNNNGVNINHNRINLALGSSTNTVTGIRIGACASSSAFTTQASNNVIRLRTSATTLTTGISNNSGSTTNATLKFNNNTVLINNTSTGIVYGIQNSGAALVCNINNNNVNDTFTTAVGNYGIYNTGTIATTTVLFNTSYHYGSTGSVFSIYNIGSITNVNYDNNNQNIFLSGNPTGYSAAINNQGPTGNLSINDNQCGIIATANASYYLYGIYNTTAAATSANINNNNVNVQSVSYCIYNSGPLTNANINNNTLFCVPGIYTCVGIYNFGALTNANINGNNITAPPGTTGTFYGIQMVTGTMTNVTVNSNVMNINCGALSYGIFSNMPGSAGTSYTCNNNTITMRQTGLASVYGIFNQPANPIANFYQIGNTIDLSTTAATTSTVGFLFNTATAANPTGVRSIIKDNIFKSASNLTNTTGIVYLLYQAVENPTDSIYNNRTQGNIAKTGAGGTFYGIYNFAGGAALNRTTIAENNISNITVAGTCIFFGINSATSTGQNRTFTNNTISNITGGTGSLVGITIDYCPISSMLSNNKISNFSSAGNIFGMASMLYNSPGATSGAAQGGTFLGNKITSLTSSGASSIVAGIYVLPIVTGVFNIVNDTVSGVTSTGLTSPVVYGIYEGSGTNMTTNNNNVSNIAATGLAIGSPKVYGFFGTSTAASTSTITNNNISNVRATLANTATTQAMGVHLPSTILTYNVYNNFISDVTAPAANNPDAVIGINILNANSTANLYFNTINLQSLTGGANFGAAGIVFPNSGTRTTLKNNIINLGTSTALTGTGIAACVRKNALGTAGVPPTAANYDGNYNIYHVNSGTRNYFYAEQTAGGAVNNAFSLESPATITAAAFNTCGNSFQTFMAAGGTYGRENATYTENSLSPGEIPGTFVPSSTPASYAYQSGLQILTPAITTDFAGVTRNVPPSRGGSEFTGSFPDAGGPVITYSTINGISYCTSFAPTLTSTITATSGVPSATGIKPRMYYRGTADATTLGATNDNTTDGWKYVEASNSSSPYTFQPDYTLLNHAPAAGTVISYFVIAQDNNSVTKANSVTFAAGFCPTSVALTAAAFPVLATPVVNTYTVTAVPSFTTIVKPNSLCGPANSLYLAITPLPADLKMVWKQDGSVIPGATTNYFNTLPPVVAPGISDQAILYAADLYCGTTLTTTSSSVSATEFNPAINSVTNGSRCGPGTVTLSANGLPNSRISWYASAQGGAPIATAVADASGNASWTTPSISTTTTYYVSDSFGSYGNPQTVGAPNTSIGTTANAFFSGLYNNAGINFVAHVPLTIKSVDIYPTGIGGAFQIWIYNATGTAVVASYSGITTVSSGPQTVPVNFYLPPGNYQMEVGSGLSFSNTYNTSGLAFPYTDTFRTITLTSSTATGYYFFYNWKVMAGCSIPYGYGSSALANRTPNIATVNSLPTAGTVTASPNPVCQGNTLTLSQTGTPSGLGTLTSYEWTGPDGYVSSGLASGGLVGAAVFSPSTTAASGNYSLTVTYPGPGCTSSPVTTPYVVVNATVTPTISGTLHACVGASSTLSSSVVGGTFSATAGSGTATIDAVLGTVTGVTPGTVTINYITPCGITSAPTVFTVNTTPSAIAGPTGICYPSGFPATYTNTVGSGECATCTFSWASNNSGVVNMLSPTAAYTTNADNPSGTTGAATISYTITTPGAGSCMVTRFVNVTSLSPAPITGSANTVCVGNTITLSDATAGGAWGVQSGAAFASVNAAGVVTGLAGGVAVISYSNGCGAAPTFTVTVNGASVSAANSGPQCAGTTLNLTGTVGTAGTYTWTGPNSFTSTDLSPSVAGATTAATGTYTLSVLSGGCTTSSTTFAVVDPAPSVNVTASSPVICAGASTNLTNTVTSSTAVAVYGVPYSWSNISSAVTTLNSGTTWVGGFDDGHTAVPLPAGFSFNFYGNSYSTVYINANGYVTFGTGISSGAYTAQTLPANNANTPKNMIALFWHDLTLSGGSITYGTSGLAPNRKFIINYNAVPDGSTPQTNTGQIVLYETSNNIDLMVNRTTTAYNMTCGIQNATGTAALTPPGENNAAYAISPVAPQGWRFAAPSFTYMWSPSTGLSSTSITNPVSSGLTATQVYTVTTADQYSFCSGTAATVMVSVNPVPTAAPNNDGHICVGGTVTLSANPGPGASVFAWSGVNLSSTSVAGPTATPTVTGVYSLTVSDGTGNPGCSPTTVYTTTVAVNPTPVAAPTNDGYICAGGTVALTANPAGGATAYTWSGAALAATTNENPTATPTATSVYSLTVSDGSSQPGCAPTTVYTTEVTVNLKPTASPTNSGTICDGGVVTLTANPADGASVYAWSGPALSSATDENPTATPSVTSTYSLTVTDGSGQPGCSPATVYTTTVTVNPKPVAAPTNNGYICNGGTVTLTANPSGGATVFAWSGSALSSATDQNPTAAPTATAVYSLTVSDGSGLPGCSPTTVYTTSVTVNAKPTASPVNDGHICVGGTVNLTATPSGGATAFNWSGAALSSAVAENPTAMPTATTVYSLTVSDGSTKPGCAPATVYTTSVTVNSVPTAAPANNGYICNGGTVTLTANPANGATTFAWSGAALSSAVAQDPTAVPTITGTYSLTVTDGSGKSGCSPATIYTTTVTVNATPTAAPTNNGYICNGGTVTLSANPAGGASVFAWSGTNLLTATGANPTAVPTVTGTYSVTVSDGSGNPGCSPATVYTTEVTVNAAPTAAPAEDGPICASGTVNLTANPADGANTYTWSGASLASSTAENPTATPTATGIYSLTVSDGSGKPGCAPATIYTVEVTVKGRPTLSGATNDGPVCEGSTLHFSANAPANVLDYLWSGPAALSSATISNPEITSATTAATGVYTVEVSNGAGSGCTTVYTTSATVNTIPTVATITPSTPNICVGSPLSFIAGGSTGGGAVVSYNWSGPDGYTATTSSNTVTLTPTTTAASGTYTVSVTYEGVGCSSTSVVSTPVTVNDLPTITSIGISPSVICEGSVLTLTGTGAAGAGTVVSYNWSGPSGYSSSSATATQTYTIPNTLAAGAYSVSVTYTGTGCTSSQVASGLLTVNPLPNTGSITGVATVCAGSATALANTATGGVWSSAATAIATVGTSGSVSGIAAGTATISYTVTNSCATLAATRIVTVNPLPVAGTITGSTTVCPAATTTLANASAGGSWTSSTPAVATITAGGGVVSGITSGTSVISYTVINGCGTASTSVVMTVNGIPVVGPITGTATVCPGTNTTLANTATGGVWASGTTANATIGSTTGVVTGVAAGTTLITYTVTNVCGFTNTANTVVTVNPSPFAGTLSGTNVICRGNTTVLSNSVSGGTWGTGSPAIATVNSIGAVTGVGAGVAVISYSVTNVCGTAVATRPVTVNAVTVPVISLIAEPGSVITSGTTTTVTATISGASSAPVIEWYINGVIVPGATSNVLVSSTLANGDFITCKVYGPGACDLESFNSITMKVLPSNGVGTVTLANSNITIAPNPGKGDFTIKGTLATNADEDLVVDVANMLGQVVHTARTTARGGQINEHIYLDNNLANGMYLLTVRTASGDGKVFHLVVER